jgi:hypothetical protein
VRRTPLLLALLVLACRRDTPPPVAPLATAPAPAVACPQPSPSLHERPPQLVGDGRDPATDGAAAPLRDAEQQRRLRGLVALDAGRFDLARAEFAAILEVAPGNLGVKALHDVATAAMLSAQESAARSFANLQPTRLPSPPWRHTVVKPLPVETGAAPKLVQIRKQANAITDEADWLRRHNLRIPEYEVPNPMRGQPGNLPPNIPPTFGNELLIQAIAHPDHTILVYGPDYASGRHLAVLDHQGRLVAFLDFAAYNLAPDNLQADLQFVDQSVQWAEVKEGILYVSHGHRTYARSSKGMNAYITALDLATTELRWRSEPLVAGAANFVLDAGFILTGYGFTAEPDHLFVLERRTGKTLSKTKIDSAPEYLFVQDRRLLLRTYDTDYEFELR